MKRNILFATVLLVAGSLLAADTKDEVISAAKKLGDQKSYSWKSTVENANANANGGNGGGNGGNGGGRRGRGGMFGPTEGKTEKGGFTAVTFGSGENASEAIVKGEKGAIKGQDGWQSFEEASADDGNGGFNPARFRVMRLKNMKAPAGEVEALVTKVKELNKTDDAYTGDLTEEGAKSLMTFGGRGGGNGPEISGAKGSVKIWIKDGLVSKYEYNVKGTMSFNGNDREMNNTTKVEIKDVGTTKVEVSEEAKKKSS